MYVKVIYCSKVISPWINILLFIIFTSLSNTIYASRIKKHQGRRTSLRHVWFINYDSATSRVHKLKSSEEV